MNRINPEGGLRRLAVVALQLLPAISLTADPITDIHQEALIQPRTIIRVTAAILVEAGCVWLLLRRWRTPHLFVLWILGMHLFTYPLFLALVWVADSLRPVLAVAAGEMAIVVIEGDLIYLICRYAPSAKTRLPTPTVVKSLLASLAGNVCSAAAFPLILMVSGW
jgi:hypothetical protein